MRQHIAAAAFGLPLLLAGCLSATPAKNEARIEGEIVGACLASPLFKIANGAIAAAVPAATLPIDLVNAGIAIVCANPARFAHDASTVEWVVKTLKGRIR